ncbi:MAG TPA: tRNA (adenine(22)-N(1))-methyltransferase TrmK [Bacillales bacterium]|nr:tRNA (adenine(22)-N(1))-methyltransferase TrmK [Bacillales bacterium]
MNKLKLSQRLHTVADAIPTGSTAADIGSDHAYLPCALCLENKILKAVAGEVAEGPYRSALGQVRRWELTDRISVRKGDGLEVIASGEVDVIVVAGMGGKLIADILERGGAKLSGVSRLVLQPNVAEETLRLWLMRHDWQLIEETILEEDNKIYEVLVAEKGESRELYQISGERGLRYGPFLMKDKTTAFRKKWRAEIAKWRRIEARLGETEQTEEIVERKRRLMKKIYETEEMLNE